MKFLKLSIISHLLVTLVVLFASCTAQPAPSTAQGSPSFSSGDQVLRLATTTSTADSGLLEAILPDFESKNGCRVVVIAVGTGQALEIGSRGDVDVVLVHARAQEEQFLTQGHGINRQDVMYNDFVLVGPTADPAGIAGMGTALEAFGVIAAANATFVSRGDNSGTHTKEKSLWASAGITPTVADRWYLSIGQGMGETLQFAHEQQAYTLTDRGTWLAQQAHLPDLALLVGGSSIAENSDPSLLNRYGVMQVNPEQHTGVNSVLAARFIVWLTSVETQQRIGNFGKDQYGQPLFYPDSEPWRSSR